MATLEMFRSESDARRRWRRVPVRFSMQCKRLGRAEHQMVVEAVDLSPGGIRLRAPSRLMTGDVVLFWTDDGGEDPAVGLKGLVVQGGPPRDGPCDAHVAWTNLSDESSAELARLLTLHDGADDPRAKDPG